MLTKNQIKHIIRRYGIQLGQYTLKEDVINVHGDVMITNTSLRKLPVKFGKVSGNFICSSNRLETLKGSPSFVGGNFNCYGNTLKSLQYAPAEVGGDFSCHDNLLTSLKGAPRFIKGNFNAFLNQLHNLKDGPESVEKSCYLFKNKLSTLVGSPSYVGGSFHVSANNLGNLIGCPKFIGDVFSFDSGIGSLFMGNQSCEVKKIVIEKQEKKCKTGSSIHLVPFANQKYLPVLFKYMSYFFSDIFLPDGSFNLLYFDDLISDIESGLR